MVLSVVIFMSVLVLSSPYARAEKRYPFLALRKHSFALCRDF